jgi:hypothetical protein
MRLCDLDRVTKITLKEGTTFVDRLSECGVGKIVSGVNTTHDVKVGETKRQAAKM